MKNSRFPAIIKKLGKNDTAQFSKKKKPEILDVLIATKLSQNTTDKSSYKAFMNLKKKYKNWNELSEAGINEIKNLIKVCGLAETKANDIRNMLIKMKRNYGSLNLAFLKKMDDKSIYEEMLQYKGIGVKTISCMMAFSLGRDVFPVDTHIHRILNRLGLVKTNSAENTFRETEGKIPAGMKHEFHLNLIRFGRSICRAVNPLCGECVLYAECRYVEKSKYKKMRNRKITLENNFIILENI